MVTALLALVREHADSVLALRIVFSICLAIVFFAGIYILRIREAPLRSRPGSDGRSLRRPQFAALAGDPCLDPRDASVDHGAVERVASQSPHLAWVGGRMLRSHC